MNYTINQLYEGLQLFRQYVESNMPYKQTVYFGTDDPTTGAGWIANLGAFYIKLDVGGEFVDTIYYKKTTNSTGWTEIGSGNTPGSQAAIIAAGLNAEQTGSSPFNLLLTLLNFDGSVIDAGSPLVLPFRNSVDTNENGILNIVNIINPLTLTIPNNQNLGLVSGIQTKLYVYVGVSVTDNTDIILAVKQGSLLDTTLLHTVYAFGSEAYTTAHVYSAVSNGVYSLRLISALDITHTTGGGWQQPAKVSSTAEEAFASDRLLVVNSQTAGIPLRQQINDLTKPNITVKDFQQLYNNLVLQTYSEINTIKILDVNDGYEMPLSDLMRYYAFIYESLDQNGVVSVPSVTEDKTCYITNSSDENNLVISYGGEILSIEPNETRHINFCGTDNLTIPAIRTLDNKKGIDSIVSINIESGLANTWDIIAKHPNGSDISIGNTVILNSNLTKISETGSLEAFSRIQPIKLTSNVSLTLPANTYLGGDTTNPFRIYIYVYNDNGTIRLCLSGVNKVLTSALSNVFVLNGSSNIAGRLYGSAAATGVPIKCIGYVQYNVDKFNAISYFVDSALDETISTYYALNTNLFNTVTNSDSIINSIRKIQDTDNWLRLAARQAKEIQEIKLATVSAYAPVNTPNATFRIELTVTYDVNGFATKYGHRYAVLNYATPTVVLVDNVGSLLAVEVPDASVTLAWNTASAASHFMLNLRGGNRKYLIWVADSTQFSIGSTEPRFRIISQYPSEPQLRNFKELTSSFGTYDLQPSDAIVLGVPTQNNILNLPAPSVPLIKGDKIFLYLASEQGAPYDYYYRLTVDNTVRKFYQTTDANIDINNGGILVELEYAIIDGDEYWILTTSDYNVYS